jgi:hypothetical protein
MLYGWVDADQKIERATGIFWQNSQKSLFSFYSKLSPLVTILHKQKIESS